MTVDILEVKLQEQTHAKRFKKYIAKSVFLAERCFNYKGSWISIIIECYKKKKTLVCEIIFLKLVYSQEKLNNFAKKAPYIIRLLVTSMQFCSFFFFFLL